MDGMEAVLEPVETGQEAVETPESTGEHQEGQQQEPENPYEPKSAREVSQALKAWRDADPANAKYARILKDAFSESFALRKDIPTGINGVRELKAMVDSVIHTDPERGELRGQEAIAALQDSVREVAEIDAAIASGDASALDSFDDTMKAGIVKMAPAILSMARSMDPEGYAAAVLPHFVEALKSSELVSNYNTLVDVLNERMPSWLPADKKEAWQADKMQRVMQLAGGMGSWLNAQAAKAGEPLKNSGKPNGTGKPTIDDREAQFNQREQDAHWNTNISPKLDEHAANTFKQLFAPYAKRLNLDPGTSKALMLEHSRRTAAAVAKDAGYMAQIKRYRGMKNPDPATVINFAKVNYDKHAKTTLESLVNERYKPFLKYTPPSRTNGAGTGKAAPPSVGVQVVSTRPAEGTYDPRRRSEDDIYKDIFRLKNGKVVQYRRN
jgi:hypothetical protein